MPRWVLPLIAMSDVAVVVLLYVLLGWPALFFAVPLLIASVIVAVVLRLTARVRHAVADLRAPVGVGPHRPWVPGTPVQDDTAFTPTWDATHHTAWDSTRTWDNSPTTWDNGSTTWDSGCSTDSGWSDSGSSSSSDSSCSSDSGSSSSSSD